MFSQDEDDNQRVALGLVFGIVLLVVASVLGFGAYKTLHKPAAPAGVTAVTVVETAVVADGASIKVEKGVVTFYFATGKADLATGAKEALTEIMAAVASGKRAAVSGYHDATGDAALNAELSKQRALAVRDAMMAMGASDTVIELRKPEQTQASGTNAEARRVEVLILP